jgi:putative transposase
MSQYRRIYLPGQSIFFTVVTNQRRPFLTEPIARQALNDAFSLVKQLNPFEIVAICLLPDHLHCIWTLPENDFDFSSRWRSIKALFSRKYLDENCGPHPMQNSKLQKGELGIWQRRFWDHVLRNETDFQNHLNYIHFNPVKHGWVKRVGDWPWSSFHRYVAMGCYPADWGEDPGIAEIDCVE